MHDANGITTSRITIADSRAGTAILRSCPLHRRPFVPVLGLISCLTMTAITDDREVARDKFRCMDCRGKYTLHTHHGFGYVTATWSRPGPVPRYLAGGLLRALTDGTKWKSSIDKKCWNDVVLASMSLVWTPAMTPWPWRRSDRTFRARDLDLHRTLSGLSDGALGELFRGPGCARNVERWV